MNYFYLNVLLSIIILISGCSGEASSGNAIGPYNKFQICNYEKQKLSASAFIKFITEVNTTQRDPNEIESILEHAGFRKLKNRVFYHKDYPNEIIKLNHIEKRKKISDLIELIIHKNNLTAPVVPKKYMACLGGDSKFPLLIVERLDVELDPAKNYSFYKSLSDIEAAEIAYVILKSKIGDTWFSENLPRIKDKRQLAFIDTEMQTDSVEKTTNEYKAFIKKLDLSIQQRFKDITTADVNNIRKPHDLLF